MRLLRFLAVILAASGVLAGAVTAQEGKPAVTVPKAPEKQSLAFPYNRTFVAVKYKDQFFKDDRPTLRLSSQNRGTGWSACNNWSATILARFDQRVAVGPVALTKRSCDARLMHNEQVFIFVMRTAQTWFFDGKTLTLDGPYGALVFEPSV